MRWPFSLRRFKKLRLCTESLLERTRLAVHKQSFSKQLPPNKGLINSGKFWIWIKEHSFHVSWVMVGSLLCSSQHLLLQKNTHKISNPVLHLQLGLISTSYSRALYKIPKWLSFQNEFCSQAKFVLHSHDRIECLCQMHSFSSQIRYVCVTCPVRLNNLRLSILNKVQASCSKMKAILVSSE